MNRKTLNIILSVSIGLVVLVLAALGYVMMHDDAAEKAASAEKAALEQQEAEAEAQRQKKLDAADKAATPNIEELKNDFEQMLAENKRAVDASNERSMQELEEINQQQNASASVQQPASGVSDRDWQIIQDLKRLYNNKYLPKLKSARPYINQMQAELRGGNPIMAHYARSDALDIIGECEDICDGGKQMAYEICDAGMRRDQIKIWEDCLQNLHNLSSKISSYGY